MRLATCVVDVTTNGAVPVAMLDVNIGDVMLAVTVMPPTTLTLPVPFGSSVMFSLVPDVDMVAVVKVMLPVLPPPPPLCATQLRLPDPSVLRT